MTASVWARSLLALVALAALFQGRAIYYLLYALAGVYLVHRTGISRALGRLSIRRALSRTRLFPGERARVEVAVSNPTRAPIPWARLSDQVEKGLTAGPERELAFALAPRGEVRLAYEIEATKRGRYAVGPVEIEAGDPFGIERFSARGTDVGVITVYPRVHEIGSLGVRAQAQAGALRARGMPDPGRVAGVRDYEAGDSVRYVHWRATAHTGALKVKVFEPAGALDVAVVLDLAYGHYAPWNVSPMSELAIETAASVLAWAAGRRRDFGLHAHCEPGGEPSPSPPPRATFLTTGMARGEEHLQACLEELALVQLTERRFEAAPLIEALAVSLRRGTSVIWVSPKLDGEAAAGLDRLRQRGLGAMWVHVTGEGGRESVPTGIRYARVSYPGDVLALNL